MTNNATIFTVAYLLMYLCPFIIHVPIIVHKELTLISAIDETKSRTTLIFKGHNEKLSIFMSHLINDIAVGRWQIKVIKSFLFTLNSQFRLICIIKEKYCT